MPESTYLKTSVRCKDRRDRVLDLDQLWSRLPGMVYSRRNTPDWAMRFASPGSAALSGYAPEELTSGNPEWGSLIHADDRARAFEKVQSAVQRNQPFEIPYRILTRDAGQRWILDIGAPVSFEGETAVVEGFAFDATGQAAQRLFERHRGEQLKTALQSDPVGISMVDKSLCIVSVNTVFATMLGYSVDDLIGHHFSEFTHPDDVDATEAAAIDSLENGAEYYTYNKRYLHKDGRIVHAAVTVGVVHDAPARPRFVVANIVDLTARIDTETQLSGQQERIVRLERLSLLGEMMAGIAHEINQPLTAISAYAQSGLRFMNPDNPNPQRLTEILEKLSAEVRRAGGVVERIRDLARRRDGQYEQVDCNEMLRLVKKLVAPEVMSKGMVVELDLAPGLLAFWGDPIQLQQVILNLLRNAMNSMTSVSMIHGNEILVRSAIKDDSTLQIDVVDKGEGVSDEIAEDMFQPFCTQNPASLGLGLSVSRTIVEAHGGTIECRVDVSGQPTFRFTLPLI